MDHVPDEELKTLIKKESSRYKIDMDAAQLERSCRLALAYGHLSRQIKIYAEMQGLEMVEI